MSRPAYCPACGAALTGKTAAVAILDVSTGDGGYDCYCASCGWSGDVYPDDEHGDEGTTERLDEVYGGEGGVEAGLDPEVARLQERSLPRED